MIKHTSYNNHYSACSVIVLFKTNVTRTIALKVVIRKSKNDRELMLTIVYVQGDHGNIR